MQRILFASTIAFGLIHPSALAEDVEFDLDENLFDEPAVAEKFIEDFSSDSPLYEGLWPMTIEAFRGIDCPAEVLRLDFAFPEAPASDAGMTLALNSSISLRESLWKATRDKFADLESFGRFTR